MTILAAVSKPAWAFRAQATGSVLDLAIYDVVDPNAFSDPWFGSYGVSASQMLAQLKASPDVPQINVRINSGGGDVFDGMAIYNLLQAHPANVSIYVDGLCASIASVIAMAGNEIVMGEGAWMMIHNPYSALTVGAGSDDLRATADVLDKMSESMCAVYCARTGQKTAAVQKAMAAETWMTAAEALELGYCTKITPANAPVATETNDAGTKAMADSLLKNFARVPAGAFMAMARAHGDRMQIQASAAKPVASTDENPLAKELEALKAELASTQGLLADAAKKLATAESAPPVAPALDAEAQALAKLAVTARALTGSKSLAEAEAAIVALAAKNDKLERLDSEMSVMRSERHQARVSTLIAEGKLKPSRKEYFLRASAAELDAYLVATGGEVIAPIGQEFSQPAVRAAVEGKGSITAADRVMAKHLDLNEEQLQQAADLRAQKFGK